MNLDALIVVGLALGLPALFLFIGHQFIEHDLAARRGRS